MFGLSDVRGRSEECQDAPGHVSLEIFLSVSQPNTPHSFITTRIGELLSTLLLLCLLSSSCLARIDVMSVGAHVGSVVSATSEIRQDAQSIGHAHGMLLLCGSHLCKELNGLRGALAGEAEDVEETKVGTTKLRKPLDALINVLTSTALIGVLAFGGLLAALMEVIRDSRPGGHHGAVFLAINDLCSYLEESGVAKGRLLQVCENYTFRLFLLLNATIYSAMETIRDFKMIGTPKLGAHHGVLWLALSKTFKCIEKLESEYAKENKV